MGIALGTPFFFPQEVTFRKRKPAETKQGKEKERTEHERTALYDSGK